MTIYPTAETLVASLAEVHIYTITHPAKPGDCYLGQTQRTPKQCMWQHRYNADRGQMRLYHWWRKCVFKTGVEPVMVVIESATFDSKDEAIAWANERKVHYVARMREAARGKCVEFRCLGSARTPEQRSETARMREAAKTPEQRSETARMRGSNMTTEQKSEAARKGQAARTSEQRSEAARKGQATRALRRAADRLGL